MQAFGLVAASHAVDTALLIALALMGSIATAVAENYAVAAAVLCLGSYVLLCCDSADRRQDHHLALPQMAASVLLQLGVVVVEPAIGGLMLMSLAMSFAFGAWRLSPGVAGGSALVLGALLSASIAAVGERLALPADTPGERLVSALWCGLVLGRGVLLGWQGSRLQQRLVQRNRQLAQAVARLEAQAQRDPLTGLPSRAAMLQRLEQEHARLQRHGGVYAVALLAPDPLAAPLADAHATTVMQHCGPRLAAALRETDALARGDGDRFILLLTQLDAQEPHGALGAGLAAVDRLRARLAIADVPEGLPDGSVSLSAGLALAQADEPPQALLARAAEALAAAQQRGVARVLVG